MFVCEHKHNYLEDNVLLCLFSCKSSKFPYRVYVSLRDRFVCLFVSGFTVLGMNSLQWGQG